MRRTPFVTAGLTLVVLLAPGAGAQDSAAADPGTLAADLESMIAAMNAYVGDYHLTEADLEALRQSELELPNPAADDDEGPSLRRPDGSWDFEAILRDPEVRAWLRANGIDGRRLLRAALRASLLEMRRSLEDAPDPEAQAEAQLRQLESARSQLGEETYREIAAAIRQGIELQRRLAAVVEKIPPPTGAELELLERYRDVLSGDEEEVAEVEEEPGDW